MAKMKIFEFRWNEQEEKEWVAANTNIEALKIYLSVTGTDIIDLDNTDEIVELPPDKWDLMFVENTEYDPGDPEDWWKKSFAQWMEENEKPDIIAGTMWE